MTIINKNGGKGKMAKNNELDIDISIVNNKDHNKLYIELKNLISKYEISYWTLIGILECTKQDIMDDMLLLEDEDT